MEETTRLWYLPLRILWLLLPKYDFWEEDRALGSISTKIGDFSNISQFPKILLLIIQSFGNSWGNSYTKFIISGIKFVLLLANRACTSVKFQNIMTRIIGILSLCKCFMVTPVLQRWRVSLMSSYKIRN